jgi:hypothetical protein
MHLRLYINKRKRDGEVRFAGWVSTTSLKYGYAFYSRALTILFVWWRQ